MNFKKFHESRNLFDITAYSTYKDYPSVNGISFTAEDDNYTINGNATANATVYLLQNGSFSINGVMTLSFAYSSGTIKGAFQSTKLGWKDLDSSRKTFTFDNDTITNIWVQVPSGKSADHIKLNFIICTGSQPLPYEPYSSEVWHDIPYYQHKTATDTLTLPAVIYPNDTSITVGLKGNEEHTGTPSPQSPVVISGTGDLETTGEHAGQYKIPILLNSQTISKYLGEVQTIRQIRKLVLTGQENWQRTSNGAYYLGGSVCPKDYLKSNIITVICSHYEGQTNTRSGSNEVNNGCICFYTANGYELYIGERTIATAADFKSWLQQQYANGTPVTVWYVLATPQTAVVNEPLMKIGTYADSLTTSIPCTAGENSFDVQTTVQPSEVTATFEGWHNASEIVHRYQYGEWDGSPPPANPWEQFRDLVRSGEAQSLYPIGTKLYENWGDTTSDAWIVVDYPTGEDYLDSDLAQQGYTNRVMLMEEGLNYLRQFDAIEAWLYVETAIPAGTYRFTIPNYDTAYGGNKTYIFTSTANVPVGGQITLTWAYQANPSAVQGYSSPTSTTALFNVSIAEWDGGTPCIDLGTIKLAQDDPDSTYGKLNHIHRSRYGSNNYYQSGYRQWLNTNASANWWMPTNVFDRPYVNRTNAGRLNVMNSNMKSVLATPTVNCITNNLFEYPSLDGTTFALQTAYTVKDKLFPVTHTEVNLSSTPNVNSVLDYYVGAQNADRIKYRKDNGNAYYWWLRTPSPTYAGYVCFVSASGALTGSTAFNTRGSAAACIIQ